MEHYFPKIPKRCPEGQEQRAVKKTRTETQTSAPGSSIQGATMSAFLGGDPEQRIEKALLEIGVADEMGEDEDDEKGPALDEFNDCSSFSEDSREVLAHLGYLDSLKAFLQKCTWCSDWRPASLSPTGDFITMNDDWASHDLSIDEKWAAFTKKVGELSDDKIEISTLVKPSGPSSAVIHPDMGH
ncbi:hypothetical protein Neosp_002423 [[Neocosmospora] mangrovei]